MFSPLNTADFTLLLAKYDTCPEPEDRSVLMKTWTCEQIEEFRSIQLIYIFSTLIVTFFELVMYSYLSYKLVLRFREERERKQEGSTAL